MIGTHAVLVYADRAAPAGASVDVSCLVDDLAIVHGRTDIANQPDPSACTINVTVGPGAPMPAVVDIGAWLKVTTTVAGVESVRFLGRVTDMAIGWDAAGEATPDTGVGQVVATSTLADYARAVIGDEPWPQELDGARVARAFAAAGLILNPATSDPGTVDVVARDVDSRAALEVARGTADSAGGLVWETRAGEVRYADSEHRRGTTVAVELDACDVLVTPTWTRNLGGLVNEVTMAYGRSFPATDDTPAVEAPEPYYAENADSRAEWGRYAYSTTTELADLGDVSAAASLLLTQNAGPVWMLNALPVDVHDLDAARTHQLLALEVHDLVRVAGFPSTGPTPTAVVAWVEGWTERLAWMVHDLELTVSDYCRTAPPPRWDDTNPATTWDSITPATTTWDDLACPGAPSADLGRWDDVAATTRWDQVAPALEWDQATSVPTP